MVVRRNVRLGSDVDSQAAIDTMRPFAIRHFRTPGYSTEPPRVCDWGKRCSYMRKAARISPFCVL